MQHRIKSLYHANFIILLSCCVFCYSAVVHANNSNIDGTTRFTITVFEDHDDLLKTSPVYAISWSILQAANEHQKLLFDVIPTTWNSSINRLKNGKKDLVFGAFKTPERESWALFTLPLLPEESVIYALRSHPVEALSDIHDYNSYAVAVIEQSTQQGLADKLGFKKVYATGEREKLRSLLFSKRVDFVITQNSYPFSCPEPDCVKRFAPLALQYLRVMGMDKPKTARLIQSINEGLQKAIKSNEVLTLLENYNQRSAVTSWQKQFQKESEQLINPE